MMKETIFQIRVVCYSGYRGEETPRYFYLGERRVEVSEVVDRWFAPSHRYFKIRCPAKEVYILRHDSLSGNWEMVMYEK